MSQEQDRLEHPTVAMEDKVSIPHTQDMATICYYLLGRKVKGTAEQPLEAGIPSCPSHRQSAAQNSQDSLISSLAVIFPPQMILKSLLFQLYPQD